MLAAAGRPNAAVVKEFNGIVAGETITLRLIPAVEHLGARNAPIISGIEALREQ